MQVCLLGNVQKPQTFTHHRPLTQLVRALQDRVMDRKSAETLRHHKVHLLNFVFTPSMIPSIVDQSPSTRHQATHFSWPNYLSQLHSWRRVMDTVMP